MHYVYAYVYVYNYVLCILSISVCILFRCMLCILPMSLSMCSICTVYMNNISVVYCLRIYQWLRVLYKCTYYLYGLCLCLLCILFLCTSVYMCILYKCAYHFYSLRLGVMCIIFYIWIYLCLCDKYYFFKFLLCLHLCLYLMRIHIFAYCESKSLWVQCMYGQCVCT